MSHQQARAESIEPGSVVPGFIRWESAEPKDPEPNTRGVGVGIFGLANGLARDGRLSDVDRRWWRSANDWFDAAYPDPAGSDPTLFDRTIHPRTTCWFRTSATHLPERVDGYLALLDRYRVAWVEHRSADPGRVLYADDVQVVVVPGELST